MIMLNGGHYPVYPHLPYGLYSHVEPVVGILSDHPLSDENFYDDDVILHYTDVSQLPFEDLKIGSIAKGCNRFLACFRFESQIRRLHISLGTPNSSILIEISIINHPFLGTAI